MEQIHIQLQQHLMKVQNILDRKLIELENYFLYFILDDVLLKKNMIFLIINLNNIDVVQRKKSILIEVRLRWI
jgi:hypothetical protein